MKNLIRYASASLAFSLAALSVHATDAGYVDMGRFKAAEGCQFVEIDLGSPLLKFAARLVAREDQEAAALIRGLKRVRVNVVGYDDATCADTTDRLHRFRTELVGAGWQQIVTARGSGQAEDVVIYVKLAGDETIDGVVVTVLDAGSHEAVFVNVVGSINADQLSALGERLHIAPLADLKISSSGDDA
jgi:hypothetical protein